MNKKSNNPLLDVINFEPTNEGLLTGYSFCVKDNFNVKGFKTGAGNPVYRDLAKPALSNAASIELLLNSGANLIGKTKMCEFAYGTLGTGNPYGDPLNPKAPDSIVGGSSSGSASAVASNISDFALGTDTACSVRLPASVCGLFGMRPTHGKISMNGVMPLSESLDTVGWFAREAKLLKLVGQVLLPSSNYNYSLDEINLLVATDAVKLTTINAQNEFNRIIENLSSLFKRTNEILIGEDDKERSLNMYWFHAWRLQVREVWEIYSKLVSEVDLKSERFNKKVLSFGESQTEKDIQQSKRTFDGIGEFIRSKINEGSVLCIPTTISEPPKLDASEEELMNFARTSSCLLSVAGIAGLPQISLPIGTVKGKPFGVSLVGWKGSDLLLLDLAENVSSLFKLDE